MVSFATDIFVIFKTQLTKFERISSHVEKHPWNFPLGIDLLFSKRSTSFHSIPSQMLSLIAQIVEYISLSQNYYRNFTFENFNFTDAMIINVAKQSRTYGPMYKNAIASKIFKADKKGRNTPEKTWDREN